MAAGVLVALGIDGLQLLRSEDPTERVVLQLVAEQASEQVLLRDQNLAVLIANAVGQLFK